MNKYFKKSKKIRKYNNYVEATHATLSIKKIFGMAVFEYKTTQGTIVSKFTYWGLVCFLFWYSLFIYCAYTAYTKDQSILRLLYDTKLKQYGDDYERIATTIYVAYAMWKLPFSLNANTDYVQYNFDIDKSIESLGVSIDYDKFAIRALIFSLSHLLVFFARGMCMWVTIGHLDTKVPHERMFQVAYTDVIALMISGYYCFSVATLRERYSMVNSILNEIKAQKCWEYSLFVRGKPTNMDKTVELQEQYICKKIRMCAKIHCMLFKVSKRLCDIFGFAIVVTMFFSFSVIVLYMFYFMEATASCLFHDLRMYVFFLMYVFWQTAYAISVVFIIVLFSENAAQVVSSLKSLLF